MSGPETLRSAGVVLAVLSAVCAALAARAYRLLDIRGVRADLAGCEKACAGSAAGAGRRAVPGLSRLPGPRGPAVELGARRACARTGPPSDGGPSPGEGTTGGGGAPARFVVMHREIVASCDGDLEGMRHGN